MDNQIIEGKIKELKEHIEDIYKWENDAETKQWFINTAMETILKYELKLLELKDEE
tara:strand:+ start:2885 stop:3052 length:168 start_codon:yes stop_codon:yes gene_type:complete